MLRKLVEYILGLLGGDIPLSKQEVDFLEEWPYADESAIIGRVLEVEYTNVSSIEHEWSIEVLMINFLKITGKRSRTSFYVEKVEFEFNIPYNVRMEVLNSLSKLEKPYLNV